MIETIGWLAVAIVAAGALWAIIYAVGAFLLMGLALLVEMFFAAIEGSSRDRYRDE